MKFIEIGNQKWSTQNSTIKSFSNGEKIHYCENKEDWINSGNNKIPSWCYYNFNEENEKYGILYNGFVFMNNLNISQDGYRIADFVDYNELNDFIGGKTNVDDLKSSDGWEEIETDDDGVTVIKTIPLKYDDKYGFNCLPSGWVDKNGEFYQLGSISKFWTCTDDDLGKLWARIVGFRFASVAVDPKNGYSARLIQD